MKNKADDYKVRALPKFAPVRRPISLAPAKKLPEKNFVQPTLFEQNKPAKATFTPAVRVAPVAVVKVVPPAPAPATPASLASPEQKNTSPTPKTMASSKNERSWKKMLKEIFFGRRKRVTGEKTVQTELALEQVTVMRNDLSDADLEVVTKAGLAASHSTLPLERTREMAGLAWTRLTARIFNPNEFEAKSRPVASEAKAAPEASAKVEIAPAAQATKTEAAQLVERI